MKRFLVQLCLFLFLCCQGRCENLQDTYLQCLNSQECAFKILADTLYSLEISVDSNMKLLFDIVGINDSLNLIFDSFFPDGVGLTKIAVKSADQQRSQEIIEPSYGVPWKLTIPKEVIQSFSDGTVSIEVIGVTLDPASFQLMITADPSVDRLPNFGPSSVSEFTLMMALVLILMLFFLIACTPKVSDYQRVEGEKVKPESISTNTGSCNLEDIEANVRPERKSSLDDIITNPVANRKVSIP